MTSTENDWRHRAHCTIDDIPLFDLAGKRGPDAVKARRHAVAKCMACPVLNECREDIMRAEGNADTRRREEFRAGLTPGERTKLARARRLAAQNAAARTLADTRGTAARIDAALDAVEQSLLDQQIALECGPDTRTKGKT